VESDQVILNGERWSRRIPVTRSGTGYFFLQKSGDSNVE